MGVGNIKKATIITPSFETSFSFVELKRDKDQIPYCLKRCQNCLYTYYSIAKARARNQAIASILPCPKCGHTKFFLYIGSLETLKKVANTIFGQPGTGAKDSYVSTIKTRRRAGSHLEKASQLAEMLFNDGNLIAQIKKALFYFSKIPTSSSKLRTLAQSATKNDFLDLYAEIRFGLLFHLSRINVECDPNNLDFRFFNKEFSCFGEVTRIRNSEKYDFERDGFSDGSCQNADDFSLFSDLTIGGKTYTVPVVRTNHYEVTPIDIKLIQQKILSKISKKAASQLIKYENAFLLIWDDRPIQYAMLLEGDEFIKAMSNGLKNYSGLLWMGPESSCMYTHASHEATAILNSILACMGSFLKSEKLHKYYEIIFRPDYCLEKEDFRRNILRLNMPNRKD